MSQERVVLLADDGEPIGTAPKATVHHEDTPLHLGFSCYVLDDAGRLLVTQRALRKRSFPGVWTNSVCGHPQPGEDLAAAVERRARHELGIRLRDVRPLLPHFRYRAVAADGLVENEICPVFAASTSDAVAPDATEVEAFAWVPWADFRADVLAGRRDVSAWCVDQVHQLPEVLSRTSRRGADLPGLGT